MKPYGVFVDVGNKQVGLLHISQISKERLTGPDQVFKQGDEVVAMVLSIKTERGRLTLSTKRLEQEAGDMLRDPRAVYAGAEGMAEKWRSERA